MFQNAGKNPNAQQQAAQQQAMLQSIVGGLATTMLVGDVFAPSWSRDDEEAADLMGYDLAGVPATWSDRTKSRRS